MKSLTGKVVSTKMSKTLIVEISRIKLHPIYKKPLRKKKRLKVHNEDSTIAVGDIVQFVPVRPISKEKHFKVVKNRPKALK